jgi:hypothetical protein
MKRERILCSVSRKSRRGTSLLIGKIHPFFENESIGKN